MLTEQDLREVLGELADLAPERASFDPARHAAKPRRRKVIRYATPLLAAAAVAGLAIGIGTIASHPDAQPAATTPLPTQTPSPVHTPTATPMPTRSATVPAGTKLVSVTSPLQDGATYGIGMPIVLRFNVAPTDSTEFVTAATVTVNGKPADGAWFWEKPTRDVAMEAHYRARTYWPAHATIQVSLPGAGVSAGKGLAFAGNASALIFHTGAAHRSVVDNITHRMTVYSDGKQLRQLPVSLGKSITPTYNGVKVVMAKSEHERVVSSEYDETIDWAVRLTSSGEYVYAQPATQFAQGKQNVSHGSTNLSVDDGKWFFDFSRVGDVLEYANTGGTQMPSWDGYGDWNVPWATWSQGGLLHN